MMPSGVMMPDGQAYPSEILIESELYPAACLFANARLSEILARRAGSGQPQVFVQDVATTAGTESGRWTRPDIAALAISRGEFVPYWRADLHTFEVKTARAVDVTGVHEANAHGRLGHYAWLTFQAVGRASPDTQHFSDIINAAAAVGVSVVIFINPADPSTWSIANWPARTGADNAVSDAFVRERFSSSEQARIRDYLDRLGWSNLGGGEDAG